MMIDKLIEPDSLRAGVSGATVGLRLPWYRSLPVSTVEVDAVKVDGETVPLEQVTFSVDGDTWPVDELKHRTDRSWDVVDTATLSLGGVELERNTTHDVEVTISVYPPYIIGLRRAVRWSRQMEAK